MLKWCSLGLGNLSLMLQQYDGEAEFKKPEGIDLYIVCVCVGILIEFLHQ